MLQTFFAIVLITVIIIPIPLLVFADKRQKRKAIKSMLDEFHRAGSESSLTLSSQEVLRDRIMGLDGVQRKVLMVEKESTGGHDSQLLNLDEVKDITVWKQYKAVGGSTAQKPEQLLETIALRFYMPHGLFADFVFYNYMQDPMHCAPEMENKAKQWKAMLAKMQSANMNDFR